MPRDIEEKNDSARPVAMRICGDDWHVLSEGDDALGGLGCEIVEVVMSHA